MPTHTCVVFCTVPNEETGVRIARALLEENLVACVNLLPQVRSIYRFNGNIEDERELMLIIKTRDDRYERLEERIRELHPYEVAEVIALPVTQGAKPYLDWVMAETRDA